VICGDPRRRAHRDAETDEQLGGALRQPLRSGSAGRMRGPASTMVSLIEVEIDAVEAEGGELAHRSVQLGGEPDAGGAGADDDAMELARPQRRGLRIGAQAGIDHAPVEARRLAPRCRGRWRARRRPGC
jgi:hypothetical protein